MLDSQISILGVDTGNFYSKHEERLHKLNHKLRNERKQLLNGYTVKMKNKKRVIRGIVDVEKDLEKFGITTSDLEKVNFEGRTDEEIEIIEGLKTEYFKIKHQIEIKREKIKKIKSNLLQLLENKTNENIKTNGKHHIRELRDNSVSHINIISVFTSSLTRMIGAEIDCLTKDFMVVQVYYFQILHDILLYGFMYEGEKYIYFTSSAGQIRTKKCVFIKESVWKKYEKTIMCGLTVDEINAKGGINKNKFLAYTALNNSATDVWEEFDIDKSIVIDDFETNVTGEVDYIDGEDFSITRKAMDIPIPHTDGCGMILPNAFGKEQRNMMIRLPFIKGLLGVMDFRKFIEVNGGNPVIKDIYGEEHNVIDEDIQVIFTKSQFKLYKYYDNYEDYKSKYKQYGCQAGFTNMEEDRIKNATINYQMLQSLVDITDDELVKIASASVETLTNMTASIDGVKNVLNISPYNTNKTYLQKAIAIYPELLNDIFIKNRLRNIKDSLVKGFKGGKLKVNGKYTFILPDLYAACEYWFLNNSNPDGLLEDGEVFCWLYRKAEKLDCLRSPHLFMEHGIRKNVACKNYNKRQQQIREWFCTKAIYTSCHDLISKILQFDCDGDRGLIVADKTIVQVAERNIEKYDIVPLYYKMKKASASQITNEVIYQGLILAFTSAPIGLYSNNISKIWNSDIFVNGSYEDQCHAIDCVKRLTAYSNFNIDYAKSLYKPEFPRQIKKDVQEFAKQLLPHYFIYAKDKEEKQVRDVNNTLVNRLSNIIPNPRIKCKYVNADGKHKALLKPDYRLLMYNPDLEVDIIKSNNGRLLEGTNPVILKYNELASSYGYKISAINEQEDLSYVPRETMYKSQVKQMVLYRQLIAEIKNEFSHFGYSDKEIADILVKYIYGIKDSKYKDLLWVCYGEYLYENLRKRIKSPTKEVQCVDCGEWFEVGKFDSATCRCESCLEEHKRELRRLKKQRYRQRIAMSTIPSNE